MTQAVLRLPQVKARTGLSRSSIYKFIAAGSFPRQLRLGPRAIGWVSTEIDDWIEHRAASRTPAGSRRTGSAGLRSEVS